MSQINQSYNEIWHNCLVTMQKEVPFEEFNRWLRPITPIDFDGKVLRIRVPSQEYAMHIENNFMLMLRPIIQNNFGKTITLKYSIPQNASAKNISPEKGNLGVINAYAAQTNSQNIKNPFVIPGIRKIVVDPQLCFDYTFENFIEGECNKLARSASMSVALDPGNTPFNPLFIYGDSGLGKTHIAQAIGIEVKKRNPQKNVLYVSANKFQAQFQNATQKGDINDFVLFYQMIDVLIIDDIQEFAGKPGTQNIFFNIFNHLHLSKKQIILTADKPPVELKDIVERLITRFKWSLSVKLSTPDYQTKVKIIQNLCRKSKFVISDQIVDFLATNIKANIREIEGAVSLFIAHTKFLEQQPSLELAKEILLPYVKVESQSKEITASSIVDTVTSYFSISKDDFFSANRTSDIALARQTAMYLCKTHTSMSFKAIGSAIGGKNHSTVVHACKRIEGLYQTDKNFTLQLDEIKRSL